MAITAEKIKNLLCCAFEGGVGYWCCIERYEYPTGTKKTDFSEGGSQQGKNYWHPCELVPLTEGGAVICTVTEDGDNDDAREYRLDRAAVLEGLKKMAEKYPDHWADFLNENEDATTGDVFMQLALLGDIVYG